MPSHNQTLSISLLPLLLEPVTPPHLGSSWHSKDLDAPSFSTQIGTGYSHNRTGLAGLLLSSGSLGGGALAGGLLPLDNLFLMGAPPMHSPLKPPTRNMAHIPAFVPAGLAPAAAAAVTPKKYDKEQISRLNSLPLEAWCTDILSLARDQYGCRFLQRKIDELPATTLDPVFQQVHPHVFELIVDPFGNYLVQKLVAYCDAPKLNLLVENLAASLYQILVNQHGTRALQKIIDHINSDYQTALIVNGLSGYVIDLIKDLNGNHVIQKCLNKFLTRDCQFIYEQIAHNIVTVSTHKHGCCVLQKCLNHIDNNQQLQLLAQPIVAHAETLIKDQFGNYVIQYLMLLNRFPVLVLVYTQIAARVPLLCTQKFLLNVVEKMLKICRDHEGGRVLPTDDLGLWLSQPAEVALSMPIELFALLRNHITTRILLDPALNTLVNDPYGNYVVQTLIDLVPAVYQPVVLQRFFANCKIATPYGKRIQSKINVILSGVSVNMNPMGEFQQRQSEFQQRQSELQQRQSELQQRLVQYGAVPAAQYGAVPPMQPPMQLQGMLQGYSLQPYPPQSYDYLAPRQFY